MRRVAAVLEEERRDRTRRMTPAERPAEALALGRAAAAAYASAHGIHEDGARRSWSAPLKEDGDARP